MLPLVLTSLSQRIDEVRCIEIADYSTYYQPFVNDEMFGFGKPMDEVPFLWQPRHPAMAWGSVVRIIAAGLELDARRAADLDGRARRGRARLRDGQRRRAGRDALRRCGSR